MEFALVLPLVMVLLFGVVEVAVIARTQLEVVNAAREGAREAAANPDTAAAARAARNALSATAADARIAVSRPSSVGSPAAVTVRLPHRVAAPLLGGFTIELTGRAAMRVEK